MWYSDKKTMGGITRENPLSSLVYLSRDRLDFRLHIIKAYWLLLGTINDMYIPHFLYCVTHSCANQNQVYKFHRITWCRRVLVHCMSVPRNPSRGVKRVGPAQTRHGHDICKSVRVARRGTSTIPIVGQVGLLV